MTLSPSTPHPNPYPPPPPSREVEKASSLNKVVVPYIIDLETVNGTFVNGARVEPSRSGGGKKE